MKKTMIAMACLVCSSAVAGETEKDFKFSAKDSVFIAQATTEPLNALDKLEKSETEHSELISRAESAESKKTIAAYTSGIAAVVGIAVAYTNQEKDENGEKSGTLDGTGTAGAVVAVVAVIAGAYLASSYSSEAASLREQANKVSRGLSLVPAKEGIGLAMSYKF